MTELIKLGVLAVANRISDTHRRYEQWATHHNLTLHFFINFNDDDEESDKCDSGHRKALSRPKSEPITPPAPPPAAAAAAAPRSIFNNNNSEIL